jgi:hypothetical protein
LGGEFGEIDLVNIYFLLLDEIKKQIERSFKDLELNFVFGHERKNSKARERRWQWWNKMKRGASQ